MRILKINATIMGELLRVVPAYVAEIMGRYGVGGTIEYKDLLNIVRENRWGKTITLLSAQCIMEKYFFGIIYKPIYEKAGYRCSHCKSVKGLSIHHVDRDHNNMADENMILLCHRCHSSLHKKVFILTQEIIFLSKIGKKRLIINPSLKNIVGRLGIIKPFYYCRTAG